MRKLLLITVIILALTAPASAAGKRYISLAPSTTEILFALGLDEEIAGISSYCNYPPQAKSKEKVGTFSSPNIEKILSLRPDYIFCTGLEQAEVIVRLKRLNLKVYVSDPKNFPELLESIQDIGKVTDKAKEAENLTQEMKAQAEEISAKVKLVPQEKRPKVFIEIWNDPLTTAGKNSFIDELVGLAGGRNIAHDTKRAYSIFSAEEVIKRDPGCIILTYMSKEAPVRLMRERVGWQNISAVKNNRVYSDIEPDLLLRPGPRLGLGLKELHKRLYP